MVRPVRHTCLGNTKQRISSAKQIWSKHNPWICKIYPMSKCTPYYVHCNVLKTSPNDSVKELGKSSNNYTTNLQYDMQLLFNKGSD